MVYVATASASVSLFINHAAVINAACILAVAYLKRTVLSDFHRLHSTSSGKDSSNSKLHKTCSLLQLFQFRKLVLQLVQ
jgi:hypothetical protein